MTHEQASHYAEEDITSTVKTDTYRQKEKVPFCAWCPPDLKPEINPATQEYSGSICEKHSAILLARAELKRIELRNSKEPTETEIYAKPPIKQTRKPSYLSKKRLKKIPAYR